MSYFTLTDFDLQNISPQELGEILISAKKAYYTTGIPIMDDHTYDTLEIILKEKNPYHRLFTQVGHPNFDNGFQKKPHQMILGSQNKVTTFDELKKYFDLKKIPPNSRFVTQPKCDGISLEIIYQDGSLTQAITRGDGQVGDLVTQNVVKMKNVVLSTPKNFTGSVRCEILVTYDDFQKLPPNYSNPRNATSGITQRLDGLYSEFCTLLAVDVSTPKATEFDQINELKQLGFTVVDSWLCLGFSEIEKIYQQFLNSKRSIYPFDIDGLVIKVNDTRLQQQLGSLNLRPKGQVAYKFPASTDTSRIISIDWQVGPLGTITPVAQIEPVEISGAIITYASLANIDLLQEKGINIGDLVQISRRGDVIPHIENVVTKVTPGLAPIPQLCPECQTSLIRDHKFLKCPNSGCPAQTLGLLRLFCHVLDIKGISDKTIAKLVQVGKVSLPGDFYQLTIDDISHLDNLGDKSAQNIVRQIQAKKVLSVVEIFHSASIPFFSKARIKQLVKAGFDTPDILLNISIPNLESLPGIQSTLAQKIHSGLARRRAWIESILKSTVIKNFEPGRPAGGLKINNLVLSGLNFCITGPLSQPRSLIEVSIEANGGQVQSSVTSKTSYLITNLPADRHGETDSSSSKFISAKKLNIPIISEEKFMLMINKAT